MKSTKKYIVLILMELSVLQKKIILDLTNKKVIEIINQLYMKINYFYSTLHGKK